MASRCCEEFGCLPSALEGESPELLLHIMQLRAYVATARAIKNAESQKDVPPGQMTDTWADVQRVKRGVPIEVVLEDRERRIADEEEAGV